MLKTMRNKLVYALCVIVFSLMWFLAGACILALGGCTSVHIDFSAKTATVVRFATDASLESAIYESPDGHKITIGGYASKTKFEVAVAAAAAALEAVK